MFSYKGVQSLIFDEFPYKRYMVKCTQPPVLKYLCFDYMEFRVYKGEGQVQLTAYYPFAFSVISPSIAYVQAGSVINNNGDMPANLEILYDTSELGNHILLRLKDKYNQQFIGKLELDNIVVDDKDKYIMINTQTQLIEGLDANKKKTGNLYNKFIISGDFFWPPMGRSYLYSNEPFVSAQYTPLYY